MHHLPSPWAVTPSFSWHRRIGRSVALNGAPARGTYATWLPMPMGGFYFGTFSRLFFSGLAGPSGCLQQDARRFSIVNHAGMQCGESVVGFSVSQGCSGSKRKVESRSCLVLSFTFHFMHICLCTVQCISCSQHVCPSSHQHRSLSLPSLYPNVRAPCLFDPNFSTMHDPKLDVAAVA